MKKNTASYLNFISGTLFGIVSIMNFSSNRKALGFVYIFLAITFILLGFSIKKRNK